MTRKDVIYLALILLLAVGLAANMLWTHQLHVSGQIDGGNIISNAHHIDHIYRQTGVDPARTLTSEERQAINERLPDVGQHRP